MEFDTQYGAAKWPFDGDLTLIYNAGDKLKFKFEVVNEYESKDITFENIDYFKSAYSKLTDSTVSLNINNYIID